MTGVNDFVVKFANVNGSGSASANGMFAKAVMRMGVPIGARNIFPSNIQGLPTWYEVRVSEAGWLGRRGGGVDLMVAMNPQTWAQDLAEVTAGGFLLYDATRPMSASRLREDVGVLGVPLTAICNQAYSDPRQRQLFKNIVYVGALAHLLGIEPAVFEQLIAEDFRAKPKLIEPNVQALHLGLSWAGEHLEPLPIQVRRSDQVGDRILVDGNTAAGLGAVYGGATVCAWYPITPSTSLAEGFTRWCRKFRHDEGGEARYAIVQAEDEIASIGMVLGATWNGARAFTCTSGPGISLMQEFIGLSYFAEIPAVIFDVQRGGPSTGMPTRTQQSDLLLAAYSSHGDTRHVMLFPCDPNECFEMAAQAFDLADRLQTTVFVMLDLDIGMNDWLVPPFRWDDARPLDRGKVIAVEQLDAGGPLPGRYEDVDGDGIGWRTYPGAHPSRGAYFTRGSSHDKLARYSENGADYVEVMERLLRKWRGAAALLPAPVFTPAERPTDVGVIYFGSTAPAMDEALHLLAAQGAPVNALRVRGFPFSEDVYAFCRDHRVIYVVEQNRDAQLRQLLIVEGELDPSKLVPVLYYEGAPITARFIAGEIAAMEQPRVLEAAE